MPINFKIILQLAQDSEINHPRLKGLLPYNYFSNGGKLSVGHFLPRKREDNLEAIAKFTFSAWLSFLRKQESLSFNWLDTPAFAGVTKNGNFAIASLVKNQ